MWFDENEKRKHYLLTKVSIPEYEVQTIEHWSGLSFKNGQNVNTVFELIFPNGDSLKFDCVINVTTPFGGDSKSPNSLEFEVLSDGEPIYTEA